LKKLDLDEARVREARDLALRVCRPVEELIERHTTVAVERAVLRLVGVDGAIGEGVDARPYPNLAIERIRDQVGLARGAAVPFFDGRTTRRMPGPQPERPHGRRTEGSWLAAGSAKG
jgi:beta-lysine 5,6-aminomutase alpha subunit